MEDLEDRLQEALSRPAPGSLDRDVERLIAADERTARSRRPLLFARTAALALALGAGFLMGRWHERQSLPPPAPVVIATTLSLEAARALDLTDREPSGPLSQTWEAVFPAPPTRSTR